MTDNVKNSCLDNLVHIWWQNLTHEFHNVSLFSENLNKFVISTNCNELPETGYSTDAKVDNVLLLPFSSQGGTQRILYVATIGDDLVADGSIGNPFGTIQEAINNAWHGDTVLVMDGVGLLTKAS